MRHRDRRVAAARRALRRGGAARRRRPALRRSSAVGATRGHALVARAVWRAAGTAGERVAQDAGRSGGHVRGALRARHPARRIRGGGGRRRAHRSGGARGRTLCPRRAMGERAQHAARPGGRRPGGENRRQSAGRQEPDRGLPPAAAGDLRPGALGNPAAAERWSGLAEVVKCALLEGGELLERCERDLERAAEGDAEALAPLIEGAVRLKARVVGADEKEGGQRAFLNLGHTVGHALEAATGYERFAHGEAVALGLRGMLALSETMPDRARAVALVARLHVEAERTLDADQREAALQAMSRDKKARGGTVRFVVLERIGAPTLREVTRGECAGALAAALA